MSDTEIRSLERAAAMGEQGAARKLAAALLRAGERRAALLALVAFHSADFASCGLHPRHYTAGVVVSVRRDLCDLLPSPRVGAWRKDWTSSLDNYGRGALPARCPKLTDAEHRELHRAAAAYSGPVSETKRPWKSA